MPDRRPSPILALWSVAAAADAALVAWWAHGGGVMMSAGPRPIAFALLALAIGRRAPPQLLIAGVAMMASGGLARVLVGQPAPPVVFALGVASLVLVAGFAAARLEGTRWRMGAAAALVVATLLLPFGRWDRVSAKSAGRSLSVLSSVPLGVTARAEGRLLRQALERTGPLSLLDSVPPGGPATERVLLLQPRPMRGEDMVALDGWVRGGGHAVVLDDPQFDWPHDGHLGDPAAPLATSVLDPLVARWGVRLELPAGGRTRPVTVALRDGSLRLPSPGFFTRISPACDLFADARAARCRVGRGEVLMVADADWANPREWSDQPGAERILVRAVTTGELAGGSTPDGAGWLALALLLVGLGAGGLERVVDGGRTNAKQTG